LCCRIRGLPVVGLLSGASNVGLMLDTWHLLRGRGSTKDIRRLPGGSIAGVQISDRPVDAPQSSSTAVSERLLPGEGAAPLGELVSAILENSPSVDMEIEVFSSELAVLSPDRAGARVARALEAWRIAVWDRRAGDA
jgi:4-hydroxyphenylpyruvate dioxygenase